MNMQQHYRGHAPHGPPRPGGQHVPQRRGGIGKFVIVTTFAMAARAAPVSGVRTPDLLIFRHFPLL